MRCEGEGEGHLAQSARQTPAAVLQTFEIKARPGTGLVGVASSLPLAVRARVRIPVPRGQKY
jgi:hypothetical protein